MTPSPDASARFMMRMLREREPFIFVRPGDVDVPWMMGKRRIYQTCDGEPYRHGIGAELREAWRKLCECPRFYCGDLLTMSDPADPEVQEDFRTLCRPYPNLKMLHSEALLIHRLSPALRQFYRAVRQDRREKVLVAPHRVAGAAQWLKATHLPIHSTHAHEDLNRVCQPLLTEPWEVALVVAGRTSKLLAGWLAESGKTIIELGSALDPLFWGQTRGGQIPQAEARAYFSELWWE